MNIRSTSATAILFVAVSLPALAAPSSYISSYEEILPAYSGTRLNQDGSAYLAHDYPFPTGTVPNTAGYVDPVTLRIGAYAVAETLYVGGGGVGPLPSNGWQTNRALADIDLGYRTTVTIGAGTTGLALNTPVRLTSTMRLDGTLRTAYVYPDPGSIDSLGDARAGFSLKDPTIRINTGEGYIVPNLASFGLSARLHRSTSRPSAYFPLGVNSLESRWSWDFQANASPIQSDSYNHYDEQAYPTGVYGGPALPPAITMTIDTGTLVGQFDTYVGAVLDLRADLDLLMQSRYDAPFMEANFLNTFGMDLTPSAGFEGLAVTVAVVPEPGVLFVSCIFAGSALLARRRRRVSRESRSF